MIEGDRQIFGGTEVNGGHAGPLDTTALSAQAFARRSRKLTCSWSHAMHI